jgi:hypothetical protein
MADYREVKYCRRCKVRYLVNKGEGKKVYCEDCYKKLLKERAKKEKEDAKKEKEDAKKD